MRCPGKIWLKFLVPNNVCWLKNLTRFKFVNPFNHYVTTYFSLPDNIYQFFHINLKLVLIREMANYFFFFSFYCLLIWITTIRYLEQISYISKLILWTYWDINNFSFDFKQIQNFCTFFLTLAHCAPPPHL